MGQDVSRNVAAFTDSILDKTFDALGLLASHPAVYTGNSPECDRIFSGILNNYPEHLNIVAADMNGLNYGIANPVVRPRPIDHSEFTWFKEARKGKKAVSDLHISKVFKVPAVMIASPVFDPRGVQVGVVGFSLNLEKIRQKIAIMWALPRNSEIMVVDANGEVLIDASGKKDSGAGGLKNPPERKVVQLGKGRFEAVGPDGVKRLYISSKCEKKDWHAVVGIPVDHLYAKSDHFRNIFVNNFLFAALMSVVFGFMLSRKISRDISRLTNCVQELQKGNFDVYAKTGGNDELRELAGAFNLMVMETRKAQESLMNREAQLRALIDSIDVGILIISPEDNKIAAANSTAAEMIGLGKDDLAGRSAGEFLEIKAADRGQNAGAAWIEAALTGANGNRLPVLLAIAAFSHNGQNFSIQTFIDISRQQRIYNALMESEAKLGSVLEGIGDGVVMIDRDFRILLANQGYCNQTKRDLADVVGKHCYEVSHNYSKPCFKMGEECSVSRTFKKGSGQRLVHTHFDKFGQPVYIETVSYPLKDQNGEITSAIEVLTDVTQRMMLESQVREKMKELEEFYNMAVGREVRMIELKEEIKRLRAGLGKYEDV